MASGPFFDTNIIIDWLRDRPGASQELKAYERHWISRIVWAEVLAGETSVDRPAVEALLQPFELVEVDEPIARLAAEIRHGTRMKLLDALILATARVHGAMLITRNTKDFSPDMPGIHIPYTL